MEKNEQEMPQIDLLTPLTGKFFPDDAEYGYDEEMDDGYGISLDGSDLAQYEKAIRAMVDQENREGYGQEAPCNLMDYFHGSDAIREKVSSAVVSVKRINGTLHGCTTLTVGEFLEAPELQELCEYITGQYSDGWGEGFEQRDIQVDGGCLSVHFYQPRDFQIQKEFRSDPREAHESHAEISQSQEEAGGRGAPMKEKEKKKYEITDIRHPKYPWLRRIRALATVNGQVLPGALGGFVQTEANLSQEGKCWIYDHAVCSEDAVVEKSAGLYDGATARGSALVTGDSCLYDRALAEGNCCIRSGEIKEDARIAGTAVLNEGPIEGLSPLIAGRCSVYGEVRGLFVIKDNVLPGESLMNPTEDLFILEHGRRDVLVKQRKPEPPQKDGAVRQDLKKPKRKQPER